jgi:endoglucanase
MSRLLATLLRALSCGCALLLLAGATGAQAGPANSGLAGASHTNPLAGMPWGNYTGGQDEIFPYFWGAQGSERQMLAKVALRPRMRWFGSWYPDDRAYETARDYVANATQGDSRRLAQIAVFRLVPWEHEACGRLPTGGEQASYKHWIDAFAAGIGSSRVALVLQPDLPFAMCVPHHSPLPLQLVSYAAQRFSSLPHTSVYIDAGAGDWANVPEAASMLRGAGVRYTRGFALNATHYDTTENEIRFGAGLTRALGAMGIRNRHFVINTSSNGHGFTFQQYNDPATFDNATVCRSRTQRRCASLGIPPTTDVANPRWGLSAFARRIARQSVDAYLWIGRPWLYNQNDPFVMPRTMQLAATSPF